MTAALPSSFNRSLISDTTERRFGFRRPSHSTNRPAGPVEGDTFWELDTNTMYVWNGSAWIQLSSGFALEDTGWITLPLVNGWISYDNTYGPPRYRKKFGIVYLKGLIKNGTLGTACAVLPVGFRPETAAGPIILFTTQHAAGLARIDVDGTNGNVILAAGNATWTSLAGVTFPAGN